MREILPIIRSAPKTQISVRGFRTSKESNGRLALNQIYCADSRKAMRRIRPNSVSLSFWSPPYFVGKSYEKDMTMGQWKSLLSEVVALHSGVVKPGGFLVVNIADILCHEDESMPRIQAAHAGHGRCGISREDVLKAQRANPDYDRHQLARVLGCSEQTIQRRLEHNNIRGGKYAVQTKVLLVGGMLQEWGEQAGFYLYDRRVWVKDPCWQNSRWHSNSYRAVDEFEHLFFFWKPGITQIDRARLGRKEWAEWGSRAVWKIPSVRANDNHEAKFPLELAKRVIRLFTDPGEVVLDPFVGSGTTAIAAKMEKRKYIGIEITDASARLARRQLEKET